MLTHGSFPHKTEALEFSISIQKPWWLPFLQSGTVCAPFCCVETPIESRPTIVMHTEVAKTSDFRFRMRAQMELMEKNTPCLVQSRTTLIT